MRAMDAHVLRARRAKEGTRAGDETTGGAGGRARVGRVPIATGDSVHICDPSRTFNRPLSVFPAADVYVGGEPPRHNGVSVDDLDHLSTQGSIKSSRAGARGRREILGDRALQCLVNKAEIFKLK